jgi:hypothetical protein
MPHVKFVAELRTALDTVCDYHLSMLSPPALRKIDQHPQSPQHPHHWSVTFVHFTFTGNKPRKHFKMAEEREKVQGVVVSSG